MEIYLPDVIKDYILVKNARELVKFIKFQSIRNGSVALFIAAEI